MRFHVLARPALALLCALLGAAAIAPSARAQTGAERNYDARPLSTVTPRSLVSPQRDAVTQMRRGVPELAVTYDARTRVTRTLSNRNGYLTGPSAGAPSSTAERFITQNVTLLGLKAADLENFEVRSVQQSRTNGSSRVYLRQTARGIPVYNGEIQVNLGSDGRIISVNNGFLEDLARSINTATPTLTAPDAVAAAADQVSLPADPAAVTTAQLMFLPIRAGEARLVWNLQLGASDREHYYDFTIDAVTGQVWTRFDWVSSEKELTVYPTPIDSPNFATPAPPADARTIITDPANTTASPLGWHDTGTNSYTVMRGNNVHAYDDRNDDNAPPTSEPSCGANLDCNFPLNLSLDPANSTPAAVANLFYWNNIIHDIQYQYGFDEAAGNFQVNNFSNGGAGNDDVRAEAQDGGGNCNANFFTPPDGSRPRMQMFNCGNASPSRDGDFDNGVIVHEYGHGISIRTVGGPNNVSCLNNTQQMGEGWSDWLGLAYTAKATDTATQARAIGTWLFGQGPTGGGIRPAPYSTSTAINNYNYADIAGQSVPHGVGFVWAEILWVAYWAIVDAHGFDPDLYNAAGGAGNQRMMLYVQEGMANTACSPTFIDARDGVIQAAANNFGGEDVCRLWDAFASRGLGSNATTSGSNSLTATNGFETPASCQCAPQPSANAGTDQLICLGESAMVGTAAQASNTYSWAPGGESTAQITVSPTADATYTITASTTCGTSSDAATVFVAVNGDDTGLTEDFEDGGTSWTRTGLWHAANASLCGSAPPTTAPTAMYYGQDSSCTYSTGAGTNGSLISPVIMGVDSTSVLTFNYYRTVENFNGTYDITQVNVINESTNAKTSVFYRDASTASQSSWLSSGNISLAGFANTPIRIEFAFNSVDGIANSFTGWFVDDVVVTSSFECLGCTTDTDGDGVCDEVDNCTTLSNPNQIDTDRDGYGNLCDADVNNDNVVGGADFSSFRSAFGAFCGEDDYNAVVDFNSDCAIGGADFSTFRAGWASPPGPSGYTCAGTTSPCP